MWTKVATTPNGPSARFSVAGDCLDPYMSGVLVFVGGCNRNLEALDDMHYLYTGSANCLFFFPVINFTEEHFDSADYEVCDKIVFLIYF